MWVCNKCGHHKFDVRYYNTYKNTSLDDDGCVDNYNYSELEIVFIECCNCGNNGEKLEEVAEWRENNE